ncbi:hypothetical protein Tco_0699058 [Tanacetum coccineum]
MTSLDQVIADFVVFACDIALEILLEVDSLALLLKYLFDGKTILRTWGTGRQAGRGGGRTRGRSGDEGDDRMNGQGGQVGGQGSEVNDGVNGLPDFSMYLVQMRQVSVERNPNG